MTHFHIKISMYLGQKNKNKIIVESTTFIMLITEWLLLLSWNLSKKENDNNVDKMPKRLNLLVG